ncbi:MAG: prolyl oligopeptidase family serine peptidase [Chitinophagaceae bacterium]
MRFKTLLSVFILISIQNYAQKNWTPDQCLKLKNISSTIVSPDGSKVLYSVREAIITDDRSEYINNIWLCNADGGNHIQLTKGDKNSSNPAWSPDGKWISFTSSREGKNNLYVMSIAGGEAEKITDVKSGIGVYKWSNNGKMIAFTMLDPTSDKEEKNKKAKNDWYYMDEDVKQNRLYVLWLNQKDSSGKRIQKLLTKENYNVNTFSWSADDEQIVFSHGKSPKANEGQNQDISIAEVKKETCKVLMNTGGNEANPIYSPDGNSFAYEFVPGPVDWPGAKYIFVYNTKDGKSSQLKSTPNEGPELIGWSADGKNVIVLEGNKTLNSIYFLNADGGGLDEWSKNEKSFITSATISIKGTFISFQLQNPSSLPQAYISDIKSYEPLKLTSLNADVSDRAFPKTEVVRWKGADGKEIEGLLTYPINYIAGTKVPLILNVHGGPAGVFTQNCVAANSGTYPIAAFAEMGYAILRPNPRGSTGYGTAFRTANRADWGGKDYIDLMNGVDYLIKIGIADENKTGIMGWSYGGFMSSWTVGHTNRFKAASIGAPVVDLQHQNLTDDIEGFLPSYFKSQPWENWSLYDAHSPLRFVQNVSTPVMLQHCEGDQRVPISNGIMFYNALRRRGVPVKFLVLPRQAHGPTEPAINLKIMQSNLEWFSSYIKP